MPTQLHETYPAVNIKIHVHIPQVNGLPHLQGIGHISSEFQELWISMQPLLSQKQNQTN